MKANKEKSKIGEFKKAAKKWARLVPPLVTIKDERQFRKSREFLDYLIDEVREDPTHELFPLLELIGVLIENYEREHFKEPEGAPKEVLKFLMEEHGLTQSDMRVIGSQGVVSEILSGKRKLNTRQIRVLSERFGVSPSAFIE